MAKRDLAALIAQTFLTGPGLIVSQRIAEEMLTAAMGAKPPDLDQVRALSAISADLLKLGKKAAPPASVGVKDLGGK